MRASSYLQIAEHMEAGGRVLGPGDRSTSVFPTVFSSGAFRHADALGHGLTGMLSRPDRYELVPIPEPEPPIDLHTLERKHHNRVSNLQRKVRHARIARDKAIAGHKAALAKVAQLEANEVVLLAKVRQVIGEREELRMRLARAPEIRTSSRLRERLAEPPPTVVLDLFDITDQVLFATHHRIESLWKKEGRWLYHPAGIDWQEGYQPVPFVPGTRHGVRVFA